MHRRLILILFLLLPEALMAQQSDPANEASSLVAAFRDEMYLQRIDDEELYRHYRILRADLGDLALDERERQFWMAQAAYYMARGYQALDTVREVLDQDDDMRHGKFKKLQKSYSRLDDIIALYEESLSLAEAFMDGGREARGVRLYAESLSQLSTLKSLGFLMSNGPKIQPLGEEAVEMDPGNVKARILLASRYVYSPGVWGGDPDRGIAMLEAVRDSGGGDREDEHNIAVGIGFAHTMAERWGDAVPYFRRALEIYPGNVYDTAMLELCEAGGP